MNEKSTTPFECVDPSVGDQVWRLQLPDLEPGTRATLEAHVAACHACNLLVHVDARAGELVREGRLDPAALRRPGPRRLGARPWPRRTPWLAAWPVAACLAAVFLLPPRPVSRGLSVRGLDDLRFLRPVEGELLAIRRPALRWTPIPGATGYRVELRDREGRSVWAGDSPTPALRLPADAALAPGGEYRALLSARPADLVPPGQVSVGFRTGSFGGMVLHRLRWAPPLLQAATLLAVALALAVLARGRRATG